MRHHSTRTVFLVDDSVAIRDRVRELLASEDRVDIVGEAGSTAAAITGIASTRPEFVVLDYALPDGTGIDILRAVGAQTSDSTFIVLTNHAEPSLRAACVAAGARFFLDKSVDFDRLLPIIANAGTA
jgi:DNA-binding NarL/FixJ family response regulator